jgi:hypothetical protein
MGCRKKHTPVNRRLTDTELLLVKDGLKDGPGFDIETVRIAKE